MTPEVKATIQYYMDVMLDRIDELREPQMRKRISDLELENAELKQLLDATVHYIGGYRNVPGLANLVAKALDEYDKAEVKHD